MLLGSLRGLADGDSEGLAEGCNNGTPKGLADRCSDGISEGLTDGCRDEVADGLARLENCNGLRNNVRPPMLSNARIKVIIAPNRVNYAHLGAVVGG